MAGYENQLVQDIMAAGDLTAVDRLIRTLFDELSSKIPSVRNPRRHSWFEHWRELLADVEELPKPPEVQEPGESPIDAAEVEFCARQVVASGDPAAVETLLHNLANELTTCAVIESDPARRQWMVSAGQLLDLTTPGMETIADVRPNEYDEDEGFRPSYRISNHQTVRVASLVVLLLTLMALSIGVASALGVPFVPEL